MDNPEKLATCGTQDKEKQSENTTLRCPGMVRSSCSTSSTRREQQCAKNDRINCFGRKDFPTIYNTSYFICAKSKHFAVFHL
jgi:hypothetical protein